METELSGKEGHLTPVAALGLLQWVALQFGRSPKDCEEEKNKNRICMWCRANTKEKQSSKRLGICKSNVLVIPFPELCNVIGGCKKILDEMILNFVTTDFACRRVSPRGPDGFRGPDGGGDGDVFVPD
ncbi:unnamed protein product [Urochloa humidicola]